MIQKTKPQNVSLDHSVDAPPPAPAKRKTQRALLITLLLVLSVPLLVWGANRISELRSKAAPPPIGSVHINPELILTDLKGGNVYLSTLAYNAGGSPIWSGIRYQWGMSTTDSIGKFYPNQDDKLATFEPSSTIRGRADIWVKAYDVNGQTAIGAIPVYVGVTPSPIPTSTPTKKPTPRPSPVSPSGPPPRPVTPTPRPTTKPIPPTVTLKPTVRPTIKPTYYPPPPKPTYYPPPPKPTYYPPPRPTPTPLPPWWRRWFPWFRIAF